MTAIAASYEEHAQDSEDRAGLVRRILVGGALRDKVQVPAAAD